jgi:hypothetical protein
MFVWKSVKCEHPMGRKKKGQTLKVKRKEGVEKTKNYLFNVTQYRDLALFHVDFQATERKT